MEFVGRGQEGRVYFGAVEAETHGEEDAADDDVGGVSDL